MENAPEPLARHPRPAGACCPFCLGARALPPLAAKGLPPGEAYRLIRCADCGIGRTEPPPSDGEISRWYPEAYYGRGNVRFHWAIELLVRLFRWRRARVIRRRVPVGPVLDVGCGRGLMLGYLRSFGYLPHGVEISEHAARSAQRRLGGSVHVGDLLTAPFSPGTFEAVIFWHSLEHIRRAEECLARARDLLRPGGLLVVAVPNLESLQACFAGADWFHLDIPRHYWHFGEGGLRRLLERGGFRVLRVDHFSFEQNPYGWLQSLYNRAGFEFNLLYDVLKNPDSRGRRLRERPWQAAGALALLPLFLPTALLLMLIETLLRRGGTIEVYAERPID